MQQNTPRHWHAHEQAGYAHAKVIYSQSTTERGDASIDLWGHACKTPLAILHHVDTKVLPTHHGDVMNTSRRHRQLPPRHTPQDTLPYACTSGRGQLVNAATDTHTLVRARAGGLRVCEGTTLRAPLRGRTHQKMCGETHVRLGSRDACEIGQSRRLRGDV